MTNKQQLIKSGLFAGATILVLIVATVAWFTMGDHSSVDDVQADVEPGKYSMTYYESPDQDKDGEIDDPATWVPVTEPNIDINNMAPGENHFYKVEITIGSKPLNLSLILNTIATTVPTVPEGQTQPTKADVLGKLNVSWVMKDSTEAVIDGTAKGGGTMLAFLDDDPDTTTKTVYDAFNLASYTNSKVTIYYTIGVAGGITPGSDDILQGAGFSIGEFQITIADN